MHEVTRGTAREGGGFWAKAAAIYGRKVDDDDKMIE